MKFRQPLSFLLVILLPSLVFLPVTSGYSMEKMTDAELRQVTGKSGFINSKADLKKFQRAKRHFSSFIKSYGMENFLSGKARKNLLQQSNVAPERQAKLLQKSARNLLTNHKFLRSVEQTGRTLVQLSKALRQLQALRPQKDQFTKGKN